MESYLSHLLSDIRVAHRAESPKEKYDSESLEDHFRDVDRWISCDTEHTLGYYCGLEAKAFPPYNQLSDEQVRNVCNAFTVMLDTGALIWTFPTSCPCTGNMN